MNENVAAIMNGFELLRDDPYYRGIVEVNVRRLREVADNLADSALIAPDWQISGVLPSSHRAFVSHAFYTAVINFAFRHFGGARNRYIFNRYFHGSFGAGACFHRQFGEKRISAGEILRVTATLSRVKEFLKGKNSVPLLSERRDHLREAAEVVSREFGGDPMNIIEQAKFKAEDVIRILVARFPTAFGADYAALPAADYKIMTFRFHKRAQLLPLMYHGRASHSNGELPILKDPEYIGPISDPAVPSGLRLLGILIYSPELEDKIARQVLLTAGGREEVLIRLATVYAMQKLLDCVNSRRYWYLTQPRATTSCLRGKPEITMVELDNYMWKLGRAAGLPRHLTKTTAY